MSYYPHFIGIFCDVCDETHEGDYIVSDDWTQEQRFACARKHLNENLGWRCDATGDFCPAHAQALFAAPALGLDHPAGRGEGEGDV